nr:hypothetical protein [Tanacetum cinerariifolium]
MLQDVKSWLGKCLAMKDLGEVAYILGINIYRDRSRRLIGLSQNTYIDKILKRFKMDTSKRGTIPMQPNVDLRKSQGPTTPAEVKRMKGIHYASAVGSIMYAVRGVVDWKSSKQSTTAMSSMEAEYIAAAEAAMEAIWIRKFISGLGVVPNIDKPMDMYCDNTGAITIADEPGVQKGAKHFRRKYHFIRDVIQEGEGHHLILLITLQRTHGRCADMWMNGKDYGKDNHHVFCIYSSDDSKGVSSKGPSITSIPKEGPSIKFRMRTPGRCADKSKGKRK